MIDSIYVDLMQKRCQLTNADADADTALIHHVNAPCKGQRIHWIWPGGKLDAMLVGAKGHWNPKFGISPSISPHFGSILWRRNKFCLLINLKRTSLWWETLLKQKVFFLFITNRILDTLNQGKTFSSPRLVTGILPNTPAFFQSRLKKKKSWRKKKMRFTLAISSNRLL